MNVLFLDLDGVLNSMRTVVAQGGFPHTLDTEERHMWDWTGVHLLRKLCRDTKTEVVVSSTWRMHYSYERIGEYFDLPTIGSTPVFHSTRGLEINSWLADHEHEVTHWAILDDNGGMLETQKPHFVQTSLENGITMNCYMVLNRILKGHLGGYTDNPHSNPLLLTDDEMKEYGGIHA